MAYRSLGLQSKPGPIRFLPKVFQRQISIIIIIIIIIINAFIDPVMQSTKTDTITGNAV